MLQNYLSTGEQTRDNLKQKVNNMKMNAKSNHILENFKFPLKKQVPSKQFIGA
jgi:hypothetical protein